MVDIPGGPVLKRNRSSGSLGVGWWGGGLEAAEGNILYERIKKSPKI